jgi:anti-anti-sigma regulatory factor
MAAHPDKPTSLNLLGSFEEVGPGTIVLQPVGLTGTEGTEFHASLEQALQQSDIVIVDLLWIEKIEQQGLRTLLIGVQRAQALGKHLSFLSMDAATSSALDALWETQLVPTSDRDEVYTPDFEAFLDMHRQVKQATVPVLDSSFNPMMSFLHS